MSRAMLKGLLLVRERREQASHRALQAAAHALALARKKAAQLEAERQAIALDIQETLRRPYERGHQGEQVSMAQVQRGIRRVELLREQLVKAAEAVQKAQAEVAVCAGAHAQALKEHLLAQRKRETAAEQLVQRARAEARVRERKSLEAAQEQSLHSTNGTTH
jgi:hypothetical protein